MIRIVVDSSADYQMEEIKKQQMERIGIHIQIGDGDYVEGINITRDEFYEKIENGEGFPMTSQPSPQDYLDVFEDAKEKGEDVICLTVSAALSGTYNCANLAKDMADYDRIYVIDSTKASHGTRLLADYACSLRNQGFSAIEIVEKVEELKPRVKIMAALDTLEYLIHGGRLSKVSGAIGELVSLKPVIEINGEGQIGVIGKCLGGNKAASLMVKQVSNYTIDSSFPVYTLYSYGTENCEKLESRLNKEGIGYSDRLQVGAAIGTHTGPGAYGLAFVVEA